MTFVFFPIKYLVFANIFSKELATLLLKYTKINTYAINMEERKQPLYETIYSLSLIKLEILKTYIKANLANSINYSCKSSDGILILFNQKPDKTF